MRALASHQCGSSSYPGVDAICGLSLLLVLSFAPRGFSPGTPVFPSPQKPSISKFQFDQESGRRRTTLWICYLQIIICYYYLIIYLNEKNLIHIITHPPTICVRDGRKKTVETWLSIRETKAESGSSKGGSRKGPNEGRRLIIIITTIHYLYSRLYTWL